MKQKILVIEDEETIRENITKILGYEGFEVESAENGRIGLEKTRLNIPDLILCDILMPEINGYKVLTELRKDPVTAHIPFIFLSAKSSSKNLRRGMVLGADDYLTKPFEVSELLGAIQTRLEKHAEAEAQLTQRIEEVHTDLARAFPQELHAPLTSIMVYSEFLLDIDQGTAPNLQELFPLLQFIRESAQHLDRALQNYLLFTDLRLLQYEPERKKQWQECKAISAVPAITLAARRKAEEFQRPDALNFELTEAELPIAEQDLQKIVEELVDNALKFSPPSESVTITTRVNDEAFQLIVFDQGRGMSPQQIDDILTYTHSGSQRKTQGLGLRICSLLAQTYEAGLNIDSAPEKGTTVTLTFKTDRRIAHGSIISD